MKELEAFLEQLQALRANYDQQAQVIETEFDVLKHDHQQALAVLLEEQVNWQQEFNDSRDKGDKLRVRELRLRKPEIEVEIANIKKQLVQSDIDRVKVLQPLAGTLRYQSSLIMGQANKFFADVEALKAKIDTAYKFASTPESLCNQQLNALIFDFDQAQTALDRASKVLEEF